MILGKIVCERDKNVQSARNIKGHFYGASENSIYN